MVAYIARRLIEAVPLLLLITLVLFVIIQMTGDPLAAYTVDSTLTGDDIARLRALVRTRPARPGPVPPLARQHADRHLGHLVRHQDRRSAS